MKISYPKTVAAALRGVDEIILLAPKSALASGWHRKIAPKANLKLMTPSVNHMDRRFSALPVTRLLFLLCRTTPKFLPVNADHRSLG